MIRGPFVAKEFAHLIALEECHDKFGGEEFLMLYFAYTSLLVGGRGENFLPVI